jgi:hypothetical protein
MSNQTITRPAIMVQAARAFQPSDEGWTTLGSIGTDSATAGLGTVIGSTTLIEDFGDVKPAGHYLNRVMRYPASSLVEGMCIRLLVQDPSGTVSGVLYQRQVTFRPFWWGIVVGKNRPINGGTKTPDTIGWSQRVMWACQCLKTLLARTDLCYGHENTSGTLNRLEFLPVFNDQFRGNCSTGTATIDGQAVSVFTFGATSTRWTALNVVRYLLAAFGRSQPLGVRDPSSVVKWMLDPATLATATAALAYTVPRTDLGGGTLFDALNALITTDRGLSWSVTVSGDTALITVHITTDVNTGFGVAASPITLDLREDIFTTDHGVVRDGNGYDIIEIIGDRPTTVMTLKFTGGASGAASDQLIPDATWTRTTVPLDSLGAGEAGTWRRYRLNPTGTWSALRNTLSSLSSGVPDGTRTAGGVAPSPLALEITTDLGVGQGFAMTGDPQRPLVRVAGVDSRLQYPVTPLQDPPGIELGSGVADAQDLAGWLMDSTPYELWVTVGVREWAPLKVGWQRDRATWPSASPRTLTIRDPRFRQVFVASGTWQGDDAAGAPIYGGGSVVFDSTADMQTLLGLYRARYEVEGGTLTFTKRGQVDVLTIPLGQFIAAAKTTDVDEIVRAVVWTKTWSFTGTSATGFTTERPPINATLWLRTAPV